MISAGSTAAPIAAPVDSGLFTQTLSSPYFYGSGGSSTYSGGFGGFSGSYAASHGATYVGSGSTYTGAGYTAPFDPYGPAPTGYGMATNTALPLFPPAATAPAAPQVVYAHYGTPGTTTTAGGPTTPVAAAAPAPAAAAPATAPKPAAAPKPAEPKKAEPKEDPKPEPKKVTVKSGDSLSKIAAANGTTWQNLYELNKGLIGGNPNLIRPGQELKLP